MVPSLLPTTTTTSTDHGALALWLDRAAARLEHGRAEHAMEQLRAELWVLRHELSTFEWQQAVAAMRAHRLVDLVLEDPFTRHAFERPRGYPGDAPLLDWIYDATQHSDAPTRGTLAGDIHAHTSQSPACAAVRWRMTHLADRLEALPPGARVLSLACGHLREARTVLERGGVLPSIAALDQDPLSLATVREHLDGHPVQTHHAGVRELLKELFDPAQQAFDLVYSAGLYDYLDDRLAARVNSRLVERARVGGTVLVANFQPSVPDLGYMEAFMDWHLVYRTADQLEATFAHLGDAVSLRSYSDPFRNIVYTEAVRLR